MVSIDRDSLAAPADRARLREIVNAMRGRKVVVYGDLVADHFVYGSARRISREAPVLILQREEDHLSPGAAGNAVASIRQLGGEPAVISAVGDDAAGVRLLEVLDEWGVDMSGVLRVDGYRTPTKTRILAGRPNAPRQQIVRIDDGAFLPADATVEAHMERALREALRGADAVLVSDYGNGTVTRPAFEMVLGDAAGRPVAVDSRYALLDYPGATIATPNEEEVAAATGTDLYGLEDDEVLSGTGERLRSLMGSPSLLITRGSRGMTLFREGSPPVPIPAHGTASISDVTGAGDTVIAVLALALGTGASPLESATLANLAASAAVSKLGTSTVSSSELEALLDTF